MKNSNSIIGLALIGLAFGLLFFNSKQVEKNQQQAQDDFLPQASQSESVTSAETEPVVQTVEDSTASDAESVYGVETEPVVHSVGSSALSKRDELNMLDMSSDHQLSNDHIHVDLTAVGGSIKTIEFLQTDRGERDEFVFNEGSKVAALQLLRKEPNKAPVPQYYKYKITQQNSTSITFEYENHGIRYQRYYSIQPSGSEDPYVINHTTKIINETDSAKRVGNTVDDELLLTLGTAMPDESDIRHEFQTLAYYNGDDVFKKASYFKESKGFFGMGSRSGRPHYEERNINIEWAAVKNQFFVSVFTPNKAADSIYGEYSDVTDMVGADKPTFGIVGTVGFNPGVILPNEALEISGSYYVGPKVFTNLNNLGETQDKLMQFGFFGAISKILLKLMHTIYGWVGNWGVAIILMTVIVKLVFWPLTSYSAQSSKKMQLLQEPMKELREKYADKPEKMQRATMELFKKYGVNPLAGCLPMLVQIPIFLGLYWMLRTSAELRHEPFLWISDLSMADTVARPFGIPLNIMPLLNGVAMLVQMNLMPMSPTADPNQQRIMRFMPVMFLFIMYNFSAGLVLYWTVQSVLSIIQTLLVYRKNQTLELAPVAANAAAQKKKKKAPIAAKKSKKR